MVVLTTVLALIVIIYLGYVLFKIIKFVWIVNKIPGPWAPLSLHFFGITLELAGKSEAERFRIVLKYAKQYPKLGKVMFGHMFVVFLNDPEIIQKIYSSQVCLEKPFFYKFFGFGQGLITANVKYWRPHRKVLNDAFSLKALQSYIGTFCESSDQFVKELEDFLDGGTFDVLQYSTKCTLDSICATSFGINVKAQERKLNFNTFLQRIHELTAIRMFNIHLYSDLIYRWSKYWCDDVVARTHCNMFAQELVKERRKAVEEKKTSNDESGYEEQHDEYFGYVKKHDIFVDHLIKSDAVKFTDENIRDHSLTILSAGNETTALTVSHALLFLAMHPEFQQKAYEEVKEVVGSSQNTLSYESLKKLDYIEMVIKETLRLTPPVPLMARVMTEDMDFDGIILPKRTHVLVCIFAINRLECYWGPDAHKFNPDNFTAENCAKRHPFCYLPFSAGIRNCIGQRYALLSSKIMLAKLLQAYHFTTPLKMEEIEYRLDVALMITNPYSLQVQRRDPS